MENKKMLLLIAGLLVVLLGGASLLYSRLGSMVNRELLQTQGAVESSKGDSQTDRAGDGGDRQEAGADRTEPEGSRTAGTDKEQEEGSQVGRNGDSSSSAAGETENSQSAAPPDFTVEDKDGNLVKLSDLVGKPVVLNFWASWCPPCKSEMPDFEEAFSQYGDTIQFMMVNLTDGSRETVETAKSYVEEKGFTFPVYFDTESEAAMVYGIMAVPATFFIDAEGRPVARASGAIDKETLEKGIGMVLPEGGSGEAEANP